ncbi:MAG TPA: TSUP family transporter, partial [Cellvibrio sp.]
LSGLLGVGGGFLIVPLLLALSAVSMMQAVSTSLFIIALISSSGFMSHLVMSSNNDWSLLGLVAAGGVIGMVLGQAISHKIANALLQQIFAASLLVVCLITFVRSFL